MEHLLGSGILLINASRDKTMFTVLRIFAPPFPEQTLCEFKTLLSSPPLEEFYPLPPPCLNKLPPRNVDIPANMLQSFFPLTSNVLDDFKINITSGELLRTS